MRQTTRPGTANRLISGLILLAACLPVTPLQAEDIYKWVDGNGKTHYTQMPPPPGIEAILIRSKARPLSDTASAPPVTEQAAPAPDDTDEPAGDADDPTTQAGREADIARTMQENCLKARNNLEVLNRGGNIQYRTSSGEIIRLTEEQRQQRIEEANEQIRLLCKG